MEINRLRSIIRESISNNLKEIEDVAENAAMEAKLNAYTEAIEKVNKKIEMAESLEEMQELVDPTKLNELKKHLKTLEKSKEKLEKVKTKKNKGKEVVTDEPTEDTVDEGSYYNEDMNPGEEDLTPEESEELRKKAEQNPSQALPEEALSDEEKEELRKKAEQNPSQALPEAFLKMQKLAGVITEAQYNEKVKSLNEAAETIEVNKTYTYEHPKAGPVKVKALGKSNMGDEYFTVEALEDKGEVKKGNQYNAEIVKLSPSEVNELFGLGGPKTTFKVGDQVKEKDAPTEYWHIKQTNVDGNDKLYLLTAKKTRNPNRPDVRRTEMSLIKTS